MCISVYKCLGTNIVEYSDICTSSEHYLNENATNVDRNVLLVLEHQSDIAELYVFMNHNKL